MKENFIIIGVLLSIFFAGVSVGYLKYSNNEINFSKGPVMEVNGNTEHVSEITVSFQTKDKAIMIESPVECKVTKILDKDGMKCSVTVFVKKAVAGVFPISCKNVEGFISIPNMRW